MALRLGGVRILINGSRFLQRPSHAAVMKTQMANLRSAVGHKDKIVRKKGFDYNYRPYTMLDQPLDSTYWRMNENSKVIVVDGNIATNKTEFAKKLAEEFDLKYIPEPTEEEMFLSAKYKVDTRLFNDILPDNLKFIDLPTFYSSKNPEKLGIARTQIGFLITKVYKYCLALCHLLNTGQGVVVDRSPYGSSVYAEVLYKMGYSSKQAFKYHQEVLKYVTEYVLWKPHVYIYLGAPAPYIKEQIKKRAIPYEVGTKVLTEDYIKTIDSTYRKTFLPSMTPYSEVLVYDAHEMPEWDIVVDDLEKLNLEPPIYDDPLKFIDWDNEYEPTWNDQRTTMSGNLQHLIDSYMINIVAPKCWEYEDFYSQAFIMDSHYNQVTDRKVLQFKD